MIPAHNPFHTKLWPLTIARPEACGSGIGTCKACHQETQVMLTERGMPTVCKHCNADKVARHAQRFWAAQEKAAQGG